MASSFKELSEHYNEKYRINLKEMYEGIGLDTKNLIGKPVYKNGQFTNVKGLGRVIHEYNRAQISMNLTNYKVAPIHEIFDAACEKAEKRGIKVTGSEIVGLVPYEAMKMAAEHYLLKMHKSSGLPISDLMNVAIQSLGLCDVGDFNPQDKLLGMPSINGELVNKRTFDFIDEVSRDTPAPGGGSVAALSGALGAALGTMVVNLSISKAGFEDKKIKLNKIAIEGQKFKDALVKAIDEDTNAFDQVIKAMRMPKDTDNDKEKRKVAMETGYKIATKIPLNTVKECRNALKICSEISKLMDDEMASDVGSGALMAKAGAEDAAYNVKINLRHINDKTFLDNTTKELSELLKECQNIADKVQERVEKSLKAI